MDFQPLAIRTYADLVAHLLALPRRYATLIIGVDGCGGSGKSTFARNLRDRLPNSTIIQMDDLYLTSAQRSSSGLATLSTVVTYDIARLHEDVLIPLSQNRDGTYQRYDWPSDQLAETHPVPSGGIVIVEGVTSLSRQLAEFYDFTVWVECPYDLRLARGIERDGEEMRHMWEDVWMPAEQVYIRDEQPDQRADLCISGVWQMITANPEALFPMPRPKD